MNEAQIFSEPLRPMTGLVDQLKIEKVQSFFIIKSNHQLKLCSKTDIMTLNPHFHLGLDSKILSVLLITVIWISIPSESRPGCQQSQLSFYEPVMSYAYYILRTVSLFADVDCMRSSFSSASLFLMHASLLNAPFEVKVSCM